MKRLPHWKQETPLLQLRVILGSIEGYALNMSDDFLGPEQINKAGIRIAELAAEATTITEALSKKDDAFDEQLFE